MDIQNLQDAITLINKTRLQVASGSIEVWKKLLNAGNYLENQMRNLLSES